MTGGDAADMEYSAVQHAAESLGPGERFSWPVAVTMIGGCAAALWALIGIAIVKLVT